MAELENGSTIKFTADVDGVEEQIEAVKDEDGTITYKVESTGEELDFRFF